MTNQTMAVINTALKRATLASAGTLLAASALAQDMIVVGSACIGFDCVNGEAFGFDTLRLKENNLRLHFDDTSTSASFAANDWRIIANDSADGGANYLAIEDSTAGRQVFRVEAGASSNALTVDAQGDVGIGLLSAATDLHIRTGDSPTLRLEQDGSSGFAPQTWDLAGNETNFFIRDATNGSTLPFRIRPGAPSSAIDIAGSGDIGIGTTLPEDKLHVKDGNLLVEQSADGIDATIDLKTATGSWEIKQNGTTGRLTFFYPGGGATTASFKFAPAAVENLFRVGILDASTVDINGDLVITGQCTENDGACADYVFEPDYELRSIAELEDFILNNRHLPNVPSAEEMKNKGVNMAHMSGRLLEKVEELTLYTVQQQKLIDSLNGRLAVLEESAQ